MDKILNSLRFPNLPDRYIIPYDKIWNIFPRKSLPSAPIHAFADGADGIPIKAMEVAVRAVQDLHGQTSPYPAGGGANKFPLDNMAQTSYLGVTIKPTATGFSVTGTATGDGGFAFWPFSLPVGSYYFKSESTGQNLQLLRGYAQILTAKGAFTVSDASEVYRFRIALVNGTTYNFNINNVQVVEGSTEPTSWSPYSNICPIVGWDEAQIVGSGTNLWDGKYESGQYNQTTGDKEINGSVTRSVNAIPVKPSMQIYCGNPAIVRVFWYGMDGGFLSNNTVPAHSVATVPANAYQMRFQIGNGNDMAFGINYPSTETAYHAYNGNLVTIDFNGTVYGGALEYVGGKEWRFTPTHTGATFNGSETWGVTADRFSTSIALAPQDESLNSITSEYPSRSNAGLYSNRNTAGYIGTAAYGSLLFIVDNVNFASKDVAAFKAHLASNPLTAMWKLAQPLAPITLYADAETVTEYGDNVLYADCGSSTLTYRQDIGLVIGGE